mgnify:CR=1 FL=1|tara:strand:- start:52 stop:480 length:429 start_codon:yes stop_codon:yes gene_type:complete
MKKLITTLALIFLLSFPVSAQNDIVIEPELNEEDFYLPLEEGEFYWSQVPTVCGTPTTIEKYLTDKGLSPKFNSFGKRGTDPNGEIVYFVTHWFSEDNTQIAATVGVPSGKPEVCMLYFVFDTYEVGILNTNGINKLPGLGI